MKEKPVDELLNAFVLHDVKSGYPSVLRRMSRAWDTSIRKSRRELVGRKCSLVAPNRLNKTYGKCSK